MSEPGVTEPLDEWVPLGGAILIFVCYAATVIVFPNVLVIVRDQSLLTVPSSVASGVFWLWMVAPSLVITALIAKYGVPIPVSRDKTVVGKLSRNGTRLSFSGSLGWFGVLLIVFPFIYYVTAISLVFILRLPGISQVATQLPLNIVEPGPLALGNFLPIAFLIFNAFLPPVILCAMKLMSLASGLVKA